MHSRRIRRRIALVGKDGFAVRQRVERHCLHAFGQRVALVSRVDDGDALQTEVRPGDPDRWGQLRRVCTLALDAPKAAAAAQHEIDLCTLVSCQK